MKRHPKRGCQPYLPLMTPLRSPTPFDHVFAEMISMRYHWRLNSFLLHCIGAGFGFMDIFLAFILFFGCGLELLFGH